MMVTTATSTKVLVVNSAFMQEIKDGNPILANAMQHLHHVCSSNENISQISRQLTKVLNTLRTELALQFALEESYGYVEVSESQLHNLSETAQSTRAEHNALYGAITELAEAAEELQYRGVESEQLHNLMDDTCEFSRQLHHHEQAENDLIDQSFDLR
jgi:hypothetical protein